MCVGVSVLMVTCVLMCVPSGVPVRTQDDMYAPKACMMSVTTVLGQGCNSEGAADCSTRPKTLEELPAHHGIAARHMLQVWCACFVTCVAVFSGTMMPW